MKRAVSVAVIGVLLLATAACSGSTGGDSTATDTLDSPLTEYLGGGPGPGGGSGMSFSSGGSDEDSAQQQRVQELVATCMKDAGFEYLPYVPTFPEMQPMVEGDLEWARTYGYGITTVDIPAPDPTDDPNTAITAKMSESERAAYDRALFGSGAMTGPGGPGQLVIAAPGGGGPGTVPGTDDSDSSDSPDGSATDPGPSGTAPTDATSSASDASPGCFQKASTEVYGEPAAFDGAEFESLFEALERMMTAIDQDPRVATLIAQWSNCVADAGYPGMTSIDDARNSIFAKWADLNGWEFTPSEGGGISVSAVGGQDAPDLDPGEVGELRAEEIALAIADLGCRGDYASVHDQVQMELEKQFVEEHRDELERYRDLTGGGN